jgi:hypothetical protein
MKTPEVVAVLSLLLASVLFSATASADKYRCSVLGRMISERILRPTELVVYTDGQGTLELAEKLRAQGIEVRYADDINGKVGVILRRHDQIAEIRGMPHVKTAAGRYKLYFAPGDLNRAAFSIWVERLKAAGAQVVKDLDKSDRSVVFLADPQSLVEIRRELNAKAEIAPYSMRRKEPHSIAFKTLSTDRTKKVAENWPEVAHRLAALDPMGTMPGRLSLESADQESFNLLVQKLTDLDGVETTILKPAHGQNRLQLQGQVGQIQEVLEAMVSDGRYDPIEVKGFTEQR